MLINTCFSSFLFLNRTCTHTHSFAHSHRKCCKQIIKVNDKLLFASSYSQSLCLLILYVRIVCDASTCHKAARWYFHGVKRIAENIIFHFHTRILLLVHVAACVSTALCGCHRVPTRWRAQRGDQKRNPIPVTSKFINSTNSTKATFFHLKFIFT